MKKVCAVYKIVNNKTGDFYIGSSVDCKRRWTEHKKPSRWNTCKNKMYEYMKENGTSDFTMFPILFVGPENLKQVEQEAIEVFHPTYNLIYSVGVDEERFSKTCSRSYNTYYKRLCNYNGEILTLNTLSGRFKRRHYKNPVQEAKKYLIGEEN